MAPDVSGSASLRPEGISQTCVARVSGGVKEAARCGGAKFARRKAAVRAEHQRPVVAACWRRPLPEELVGVDIQHDVRRRRAAAA